MRGNLLVTIQLFYCLQLANAVSFGDFNFGDFGGGTAPSDSVNFGDFSFPGFSSPSDNGDFSFGSPSFPDFGGIPPFNFPSPSPSPSPSPTTSPSPSPTASPALDPSPPPPYPPPPSPVDGCEVGGDSSGSPSPSPSPSSFSDFSSFLQNGGIFSNLLTGQTEPSSNPTANGGSQSQCQSPPPPLMPPPPMMTPPPPPVNIDDGSSANPKVFPVPNSINPGATGSALTNEQVQQLMQIVNECPVNPSAASGTFIQRSGNRFVKGGSSFSFMGFNAYQLVSQVLYNRKNGVEALLANVARFGMKVGRMWAFSDNIRTGPTTWDETVFAAIDEVLEIAKSNDVHFILGLTNYWKEYLSPELYIYWAYGSVAGRDVMDFYTDETVKLLYKAHVCKVVNHVNSISGVRYRDDPTIMAWNLMNEPRCAGCDLAVINAWVSEMSTYLNSIDPNHLVTVGMEGFHVESSSANGDNPGKWALCQGIDFVSTHSQPGIDFTAAHYYPDWKGYDWDNNRNCDAFCKFEWAQQAVQAHVRQATAMNKPFVIEEFGVSVKSQYQDQDTQQYVLFSVADRIDLYKRLIGEIVSANNRGDSGNGAMFWTAATASYQDYDGYTVYMDASSVVPYSIGFPLTFEENQRFRRITQEQECADAAVNNGWRPNVVDPAPVTPIGGQREVDVIASAAAQLI